MRIKYHSDLENMWMYLSELEGTFELWDDPFGGPPEPTPLQWRIDQTRIIEDVPNWKLVDKYFKLRWDLNAAKVSYSIASEQLAEFNLDAKIRTKLKLQAKKLSEDIVLINSELRKVERDSRFENAINKISELRHQGKLLKFSEWMRS